MIQSFYGWMPIRKEKKILSMLFGYKIYMKVQLYQKRVSDTSTFFLCLAWNLHRLDKTTLHKYTGSFVALSSSFIFSSLKMKWVLEFFESNVVT